MERKKDKCTSTLINGSKVFIENGQVKTMLSEAIQQSGYMSVEELRELLHATINKQEEMIRNGIS